MGLIIYYLVLIVNPMGRILVRWKGFRINLEILCHPICNWMYSGWTLNSSCILKKSSKLNDQGYQDSAGSCNNLVPRSTKLSGIVVTVKAIFERLYLVSGWRSVAKITCMPSAPTFPSLMLQLFLDFCTIFFPSGPSIFLVSAIRQIIKPSPGTLQRSLRVF